MIVTVTVQLNNQPDKEVVEEAGVEVVEEAGVEVGEM